MPFDLFKLIQALLRPFYLDLFQTMKYIPGEMALIYILLIRCKLYAGAVISLQLTKKKSQIFQYLCNINILMSWIF